MSHHCIVCKKTVKRNQHAVSSDQCELWTHRICGTGLSVARYREICRTEEDFPFICVGCRQNSIDNVIETVNFNVSLESTPAAEPPSLEENMDVEDEGRTPDISDINISTASLPPPEEFERSTVDRTILDPPMTEIPDNEFTIVETGSQKGKNKLVDTYGFTYVIRVAYMEDDDIHKFIRKLMSLPFLPSADISRLFNKISDRVPGRGKLRQLTEYFMGQWIAHPVFTSRTWSVFNIAVMTNNFVEGWHRRMNNKVGEQSLGLYRLIPELHCEASLLPLQTRLIQEGRLKAYVRKSSSARQDEIFQLWAQFKDGDLSLSQLLTMCAAIHGPIIH